MRLGMERILPVRKSAPLQFKLPKMRSLADLPKAAHAILAAIAKGQLTPEEGERVMALLERYRDIVVTAEILPRVEVLEQQSQQQRNDGKG